MHSGLVRTHDSPAVLLREAVRLLRSFARPTGQIRSLLEPEELAPLERLQQEAGYVSAELPRLILLGEFKAGKSTLLNAVLGGEYAATDILEMTSWIARYWPDDTGFCRIVNQDGSEYEVVPDEFRRRCQNREIPEAELARIQRVDVGVPNPSLPFSLIDCPGIGSVTRENERRLIRALDDADLLIWVVDIESVGGMREAALVQKLRGQGVPMITILTKCDLLDDQAEGEEIKEYLGAQFGISEHPIFGTAAELAVQALRAGRVVPEESGVPALVQYLRRDVAPRQLDLRQRAEDAHQRRSAELACGLLKKVGEYLHWTVEKVERFKRIAASMRQAVQSHVELEVERLVKDSLFAEHRQSLTQNLECELKTKRGALSEAAVANVFRNTLGESYFDAFWQQVVRQVSGVAVESWSERLKAAAADLEEVCQGFEDQTWRDISASLTPTALQANIEAVAHETFAKGMTASVGAAGVLTAAAIAFNSMPLALATSTIGFPVFLIGAGVTAAMYWIKRGEAEKALREQAMQVIDDCIEGFVETVLRPHFFPKIAELNEQIERAMVEGFERSILGSLPEGDLRRSLDAVDGCRRGLEAVA